MQLHRRTFRDDDYGVGEPLNERGIDGRGIVARGRHWLVLSPPAKAASFYRPLTLELFRYPTPMYASGAVTEKAFIEKMKPVSRAKGKLNAKHPTPSKQISPIRCRAMCIF